jgi:hypothetical protein
LTVAEQWFNVLLKLPFYNYQYGEEPMTRFRLSLIALTAVAAGTVHAHEHGHALERGFYNATGTILSANAACAAVGTTAGSAESGTLFFPGNGRMGFTIYGAGPGSILVGNGFQQVPFDGVAGWTAENPSVGNFTLYPSMGGAPIIIAGARLSYVAQIIDENSAILTYTSTIPPDAPLGAGCVSTTVVTWVRTGSE